MEESLKRALIKGGETEKSLSKWRRALKEPS